MNETPYVCRSIWCWCFFIWRHHRPCVVACTWTRLNDRISSSNHRQRPARGVQSVDQDTISAPRKAEKNQLRSRHCRQHAQWRVNRASKYRYKLVRKIYLFIRNHVQSRTNRWKDDQTCTQSEKKRFSSSIWF